MQCQAAKQILTPWYAGPTSINSVMESGNALRMFFGVTKLSTGGAVDEILELWLDHPPSCKGLSEMSIIRLVEVLS
jgi:hypothetical protein